MEGVQGWDPGYTSFIYKKVFCYTLLRASPLSAVPYNNNQGANTWGSGLSLETIWVCSLNRPHSWLSSLVWVIHPGYTHRVPYYCLYERGKACLFKFWRSISWLYNGMAFRQVQGSHFWSPPPLISQNTEAPCYTPSLEWSVHDKQCHMACASLKPVTWPGSGWWDKRGLVLKHLCAPCPRWKHISCSVPTGTGETKRWLVLSDSLGSFGELAQVTAPPLQSRAAFYKSLYCFFYLFFLICFQP